MADNPSGSPINSNLTELWREIRKDFENLPPGDDGGWSLIWSSHPPVDLLTRVQLQSRWIWFHPTDASLCARASAIFLRAAKARGYAGEHGWLDELRYADFVTFGITGDTTNTLLDGTVIDSVGVVLTDAVKHSITLCHLIEAGAAPLPIIGKLPNEAIAKIEAASDAFMVNFMPKLEREAPTMQGKPNEQARLLRELVVHDFETAARECMALCASVGEFETALQEGIARFVRFRVKLYRWLGAAMRAELDIGFTFFAEGADPWAGMALTERDAKWRVGSITGEALSYAALKMKLTYEASERAAAGGRRKADQPRTTKPGATPGSWDTIEILFLSEERVQIKNGSTSETWNYGELNFADDRTGKPDQAWLALKLAAQADGIIPDGSKMRGNAWPIVEKRMQEIRKRLRSHFQISADPVPFIRGTGYQFRCKIGCGPSFKS
jgi:hypothetical protein